MARSELETIITDIKKSTKQISINKVDEVKVMKAMLNDKDFRISIYDKNEGYIGEKCPAEEATAFVRNIIQGTTGLDFKDSAHLAESYEFTKKDASFMVNNAKDFIDVYMRTGRKLNILQNGVSEASIYTKDMSASNKLVPERNADGSVESKKVQTAPFVKLVSISKAPRYNK